MTTAPRNARFILAALALTCAATQAQSQSAYTLTTLGKPFGSTSRTPTSHAPTTLAKDGTVRGATYFFKTLGFDPMNNCVFCSIYTVWSVSWGPGTGASVSPVLGAKGFFGLRANDKGTELGAFNQEAWAPNANLTPNLLTVLPPAEDYDYPADFGAVAGVNRNGSPSVLSLPAPWIRPTARGINNSDTIVGVASDDINHDNDPDRVFHYPGFVLRQGVFSVLPRAPYRGAEAAGINDQGTIVGTVKANDGPGWRPALWVNDQITRVGGPETTDLHVIAINNANQVLLRNSNSGTNNPLKGFVWFNGTLTEVVDPKGRQVMPTAINDAGAVVGCLEEPVSGVLARVNLVPFIWRNGVMQELAPLVAAKGVKLPTGTRLGCPSAINQGGTILAYHYKPAKEDEVTWIRLNAKP